MPHIGPVMPKELKDFFNMWDTYAIVFWLWQTLYSCRYPVYRLSTKGLTIVCLQVSSLSAIYQGPDHCMFAGVQFIGYLPRAWPLYVCRYPVYRLSTKGLTIVCLQVSSLSAIYQGPYHCMFAGIQFIGYLPRAWPLYVCRYPVYRLSTKGLTIVCLQVSSLSAIYQGPDHCMFAGVQFIGYLPRAWPLYVCRCPVYRLSTKGLTIVCLQVSSLSAIYQGPDHCMFAGVQFIGYLPRAWPLYVCRCPVYRLSTKGLTIVCLQVSSLSAIYQGPDHCMFAGVQFIGYLPRAWPLYLCRYPVYRLSTKGLTIVCFQVSSLSAIYQGPDHCMFAGVQFIGYLPRAWPLYVCRYPVYRLSTKGLTIVLLSTKGLIIVCLQVSSLSAIYQGPDHCIAIYQGPDHCMFAGIQFIGYLPRAWPLYVCRYPVYRLSTKGLTIVSLQVSSLSAIYQGPDHCMFAGIQFIGYLPRAWPSYVCRYPVYRLSTKGLTIVCLQVSSLSAIYQGPDHRMFAGIQFIGYLPRAWPLYLCRYPAYRLSTKGLTIVCLQVSSLSAIYQGPDHCMFAGIQFIGYLPRAWPLYVCRYPVYRLSTKGLIIMWQRARRDLNHSPSFHMFLILPNINGIGKRGIGPEPALKENQVCMTAAWCKLAHEYVRTKLYTSVWFIISYQTNFS